MPEHKTFRDLLSPNEVVDPGTEQIAERLEAAGWYPRTRWGEHSIRFWPDGNRPKQITLDLRFPMNEHKLDFIARMTGIQLPDEAKEDK